MLKTSIKFEFEEKDYHIEIEFVSYNSNLVFRYYYLSENREIGDEHVNILINYGEIEESFEFVLSAYDFADRIRKDYLAQKVIDQSTIGPTSVVF